MKMKKRRILSLLLMATVLFTTVANPSVASATEATDGQLNVADYKGENATQPYPTQEGKVFAGWFTDSAYTKPLGQDVNSGYAYAKFVDADVLSVKLQLTENTTAASTSTNLRMLTTVDSLNYRSVGFIVELYGKTITRTATTVYETINGYVNGEGEEYKATVFSDASKYFMAYAIEGIPNCDFATEIRMTPIWTTLDGTTVQGREKAFAVEDVFADFEKGLTFEYQSDVLSFGADNMSIAPVKYADTVLGQQGEEYGNYGLIAKDIATKYPYLAIHFGEDTYTVGSTLTYKMYVDTGDTKPENVTGKIEAKETSVYSVVTTTMQANTWMDVEVTIKAAASRVDLMLNVEKLVTAGVALDDIRIYFDNFKVHTYNIGKGVGFEQPCDKNFIANSANTEMTRAIVAYKDTAIGNQSVEFGNYGQEGTVKTAYPRWKVQFNDTYTAGKTLHFKAYVAAPSQYEGKQWKMETPTNGSLPASRFAFNQWVDVKINLTADLTGWTLKMNFHKDVTGVDFTSGTIKVYVDNFKISSYDISKGAGFESPLDIDFFGADNMSIAPVKYADTVLGQQGEEYGNYGLVATDVASKYPYLAIHFGEDTYTLGSTLTCKMYVDTGDVKPEGVTGKIEAKETSVYSVVTTTLQANQWMDVEVTIKTAASRVDLMLNVDKLVTAGVALDDIRIYFDNFKVHTYNIGEGVTFEQPCDKNFIASSNNTLMTRAIVAYKDTAIGNQIAEFGNYGQEGTVKNAYPKWSVKFNNTYTAGKTLHFKAYVAADPTLYEGAQWKMETPTNGSLPASRFAFNKWVDVKINLGADLTGWTLTMNFHKDVTGVDFASGAIKVYVDNFVIK